VNATQVFVGWVLRGKIRNTNNLTPLSVPSRDMLAASSQEYAQTILTWILGLATLAIVLFVLFWFLSSLFSIIAEGGIALAGMMVGIALVAALVAAAFFSLKVAAIVGASVAVGLLILAAFEEMQ
jgi:hypothetical protein